MVFDAKKDIENHARWSFDDAISLASRGNYQPITALRVVIYYLSQIHVSQL